MMLVVFDVLGADLLRLFVRKELESAGISGVELERYEAANPAYMSVAGLLRYWNKKQSAA